MNPLFKLAAQSAWNRRHTLCLIWAVITLSVALLLGIERVRTEVKNSFAQSVSGTDLIVGARGGSLQLVLYSVFHLGDATNNVRWKSVEMLQEQGAVAWAVPIGLGDTYNGFSVVGTTVDYFEYFRYANKKNLALAEGNFFDDVFEVVIGAEVANQLQHHLDQKIVLSHGKSFSVSQQHDDKPFRIVGILKSTGTPVDRSVFVSLQSLEAIHLDWQSGVRVPGVSIPAEYVKKFNLNPKSVTAILLGLKNRAEVFSMQRMINTYADEPLMAVLPGVVLSQLWGALSRVENALRLMSILSVLMGLIGLIAVLLAGLNERRRELAILRSIGARPLQIFLLLMSESLLLVVLGSLSGLVLLSMIALGIAPLLMTQYGLVLTVGWPTISEIYGLVSIVVLGVFLSIWPAYRAYRFSLIDGLTPRI